MSGKLTKAQREFGYSLYERPDDFDGWYACEGHEWRTATSLADRGLVEIYRRGNERPRHFDARLTPAGVAALQNAQQSEGACADTSPQGNSGRDQ